MSKKEIKHISYLEIDKGFNIINCIKDINDNPAEIKITANANKIASKSSDNLFSIDYMFVDLNKLIIDFSNIKISINIEIGNDYLREYLFEIL